MNISFGYTIYSKILVIKENLEPYIKAATSILIEIIVKLKIQFKTMGIAEKL
jgi:hypothetical protein